MKRACRFGASVGIARTPLIEAEELLTSSDVALYKAKTTGRSRFAVFDRADLENLKASKRLTDDILRGLENDEFVPHYQPQVDPFTGQIACFETIARWQHPGRGLMVRTEFQEAATDMQVDGQIDMAVFRKALDDCSQAFGSGATVPNLSFNVGLSQIMACEFTAELRLSRYPGQISLELAETIFLEEESDEFLAQIGTLRELGIQFEVDDFGSGRASIVALRRIAPDRLKIDRRLIQPITTSQRARKLVQSIVDIGRSLDIGITAEGVDTAGHASILKAFGCDRLQGDHYSEPLCLKDLALILGGQVAQSDAG